MTSWLRFLGSSLLVLGLAACDAPRDDDEALLLRDEISPPTHQGVWPPPGGTFNTAWLGNAPLMRLLPPGTEWAPRADDGVISLIQVLKQGEYVSVADVDAPDGELILTTGGGITYEGEEVLGSRWWLDAEHTHYLIITDVSGEGPAYGYQFNHRYVDGRMDAPVCRPSVDGDHWAYVVEDLFVDVEDGTITPDDGPLLIACASGALGKAITWGFSPWYPSDDTLNLYRTGVRTVMADYCGDGTSYTEDGVLIQVSNALAGQSFVDPTAPDEAVFGPDGALCLSEPRIKYPNVECLLPACEDPEEYITEDYHTWTKIGVVF